MLSTIKETFDNEIIFTEEITKKKIGFKLIFDIIQTPSRYSRILLSRYYNLFYPFDGYIPRDNLFDNRYNFDWTFESIDTNYFGMYKALRELDYYIEELNENFYLS